MIKYFQSIIKKQVSQKIPLSTTDMNIVFDGNSLTEGINGAGIDQYFPKEVRDWLLPKCQSLVFNSFGISGQRITQMITGAPSKIDVLVDANKVNLIVVNEDANWIFVDNATALQNYEKMQEYVAARYAAGFDYVIVWNGWYPRTPFDLYQPTQQNLDDQHNYFEMLITNPIGDVVVDMRLNANIGGAQGQAQNATYYNDYLHLTAAGYDETANEVINQGILNIFQL